MKYKAIAFDYFGVLAGEPATNFNQKISEITGVNTEDIKKIYHRYNDLHNTGKISWNELWTKVLFDMDKTSCLSQVLEFVNRPKELNQDVILLINELKDKGYKVALLSNYSKDGGKRLRDVEHLDKLFDIMLISGETGLAKPHPESFQDLIKKLGIKASELVFIDDASKNTESAQALGITTILCHHIEDIRIQLSKKGIL